MSLTVVCSACHQKIKGVPESYTGKKIKCPSCSAKVSVPAAPVPPPAVPQFLDPLDPPDIPLPSIPRTPAESSVVVAKPSKVKKSGKDYKWEDGLVKHLNFVGNFNTLILGLLGALIGGVIGVASKSSPLLLAIGFAFFGAVLGYLLAFSVYYKAATLRMLVEIARNTKREE